MSDNENQSSSSENDKQRSKGRRRTVPYKTVNDKRKHFSPLQNIAIRKLDQCHWLTGSEYALVMVSPDGHQSFAFSPALQHSRYSVFTREALEVIRKDTEAYPRSAQITQTYADQLLQDSPRDLHDIYRDIHELPPDVRFELQRILLKVIEPSRQKLYSYGKGIPPPWWPDGCKYVEPKSMPVEDLDRTIHASIKRLKDISDDHLNSLGENLRTGQYTAKCLSKIHYIMAHCRGR